MNNEINKFPKVIVLSLVVAILSLIIMAVTLFYNFRLNERGPLMGKPDPRVDIADKIEIMNSLWGLQVFCDIDIINNGTAPINVGKMTLFVALEQGKPYAHRTLFAHAYKPHTAENLRALGSFVVKARDLWSARVLFVENLTEQAREDRSNLDNKLSTNIQEQILNSTKPNINDAFKITNEADLTSVKNLLNEHVSWLEIGGYKMLITISDAAKKDSFVSQKGYSFRLWEGQIAGLKENQPKSW